MRHLLNWQVRSEKKQKISEKNWNGRKWQETQTKTTRKKWKIKWVITSCTEKCWQQMIQQENKKIRKLNNSANSFLDQPNFQNIAVSHDQPSLTIVMNKIFNHWHTIKNMIKLLSISYFNSFKCHSQQNVVFQWSFDYHHNNHNTKKHWHFLTNQTQSFNLCYMDLLTIITIITSPKNKKQKVFLVTNKILRSRPSNWLWSYDVISLMTALTIFLWTYYCQKTKICCYDVILLMTALTISLWKAKNKQNMQSRQDAPSSQTDTAHVRWNDRISSSTIKNGRPHRGALFRFPFRKL